MLSEIILSTILFLSILGNTNSTNNFIYICSMNIIQENKRNKTARLVIYELIKLGICFLAGYAFYSLLPITLFILALPIDIFSWLIFKKKKWRFKRWLKFSILLFLIIFFIDYGWFRAGHEDPFSFLLNWIN